MILIKGLQFEEISQDTLKKYEYGVLKEKGKQTELFLWMDSYKRDFKNCSYEIESHLLVKTSRGTVLFDGEKLKGEDLETGSKIFSSIDFGK